MEEKIKISRKYSKRRHRFGVKLNDEELAVVKKKADFMKMSVGKYIRTMAVSGEVIVPVHRQQPEPDRCRCKCQRFGLSKRH